MSTPIGSTYYEVSIDGSWEDDFARWNREMQESRAGNAAFARSVDAAEKDMVDYARKIGLTKNQLEQLKKTSHQAKLDADFAKKFGFAAGDVRKVRTEMESTTTATKGATSAVGMLTAGLSAAAGIAIAKDIGRRFVAFTTAAVIAAAGAEKTKLSFEVMLGSAQAAQTVLKDLNTFSIKTPFTPDEVIASGRALIAYGVQPGQELVKTMQMVGDVAAGVGMDFTELSNIVGKNLTQGVVQTEDLMQLAGRGVPIFAAMAKVFGTTTEQVKTLASSGQIKFKHLQEAFQTMTSEGGKYFGMMDKLGGSAMGLWSTLTGNAMEIKKLFGETLLTGLKPLLASATKFTAWVMESPQMISIIKASFLTFAVITGIVAVGAVVALTSVVLTLMSIMGIFPIVMGAITGAIMAFVLIIEDIYGFMNGKDSFIEEWLARNFGTETVLAAKAELGKMIAFFKDLFSKLVENGKVFAGRLIVELQPIMKLMKESAVPTFLLLVKVLGVIWTVAKPLLGFMLTALGAIGFVVLKLFSVWVSLGLTVFSVMSSIVGVVISLPDRISSAFSTLADRIFGFFTSIPDKVVDLVSSIPDRVRGSLSSIGGLMTDLLKEALPERLYRLVVKTAGLDNLEGRASGGPVYAGTPYKVGERGEELFVPETDGTIIPNHALGKGSAGRVVINVSTVINITGSVRESIADIERAVSEAIERGLQAVRADLGLEAV